MQARLPERVFQPIFKFIYFNYRIFNHYYFLRHYFVHLIGGNRAGREMVREIFSIMPYSLVGESGLIQTYTLARELVEKEIAGAFVELGVARGGCGAMMARVADKGGDGRSTWLLDSYEGLPDPTSNDFNAEQSETGVHIRPLPRGSCLGTYEEVRALLFEKKRLDPGRVFMVKGWFQETLPEARQKIGPIALLRLDCDWYESTLYCLENLYGQVVPGGYVVIDDYGTCHGCKLAVDEFLQARRIETKLTFDGRGGCFFRVEGEGNSCCTGRS